MKWEWISIFILIALVFWGTIIHFQLSLWLSIITFVAICMTIVKIEVDLSERINQSKSLLTYLRDNPKEEVSELKVSDSLEDLDILLKKLIADKDSSLELQGELTKLRKMIIEVKGDQVKTLPVEMTMRLITKLYPRIFKQIVNIFKDLI